jgi:hypothetical protein
MSRRTIELASLLLDNKPETTGLPGQGDGIMVLKVSVDYEEGGVSYFSGRSTERGYYLHLTPITRRGGYDSFTIGGAYSGIKGLIEPAKRFNQKTLNQHAAAALDSELYQRLLAHMKAKGIVLSADREAALQAT